MFFCPSRFFRPLLFLPSSFGLFDSLFLFFPLLFFVFRFRFFCFLFFFFRSFPPFWFYLCLFVVIIFLFWLVTFCFRNQYVVTYLFQLHIWLLIQYERNSICFAIIPGFLFSLSQTTQKLHISSFHVVLRYDPALEGR